MFSTLLASIAFAQLAAPGTVQADRLQVCLGEARTDPATAIANASEWLAEAAETERALPQQCLGYAFTSLLRWDAAAQAFIAARDARGMADFAGRARLGAMAGNAALAGGDFDNALMALGAAQADALAAEQPQVAGSAAADRARALVGLGRPTLAAEALAQAREWAPQLTDAWLLSATLARRQGDLVAAQGHIATAAALDPQNQDVGLEAGVIAALAGLHDTARRAFDSVVALDGNSPQADTARAYLAQLGGPAPQ